MTDDRWAEVDPTVPLLLLPLRLETRSTTTDDGRRLLRVRIYPDEVAVDDLEHTLGETERDAGDAYWRAVWPADTDPTAPDPWLALVAAVGSRRAPWVAAARTPTNLATRSTDAEPVPPPDPDDDGRAPGAWARLLPDVFRVVVAQGDVVSTVVGAPVDRVGVLVGPADGGLAGVVAAAGAFGAGADDPDADAPRWLGDYALAEQIGMAVTVPLGAGAAHVDRLLVVGVRSSDDPETSAADLAALLASHAVGDGLAFLAPGTPTNNTPASRAAWSSTASGPGAPSTELVTPQGGSAATELATALGVDAALLGGLPGATDQGPTWAAAFATALWPATWGPFLERSFPSVVGARGRERLRTHAEQYVRGRGPLPALLVGRQPYGVLPVTTLDEFRPDAPVQAPLQSVLQRLRPNWRAALGGVPTVMTGDLDQSLPKVFGQAPVSRTVRVRRVLSDGAATQAAHKALALQDNAFAQLMLLRGVESALGIAFGSLAVDALGVQTAALGLPLADDSDPDFLATLLDPAAPPKDQTSVLQVLLALAAGRLRTEAQALASEERWAIARERLQQGRQLVGDEAAERGTEALTALGQGGWRDPRVFLVAAELLDKPEEPWAAARFSRRFPVEALRPHPLDAVATEVDGVQAAAVIIDAAARYARLLEAIRVIAAIPTTAQRAWLLGETLDCTSHRLDAWITSLATARLAQLRAARPTGIVLGAYGWLEDLDLVTPRKVVDPPPETTGDLLEAPAHVGVVHAPSPRHAATAAVLRGARLAHDVGDGAAAALTIDLSSARVRAALDVVDGLRAGQPLGALLGYRLERWLHETVVPGEGIRRLDRFVYVLRAVAPLVAAKVTDRVPGPAEVPTSLESVAATNVVDGVRLLEQVNGGLDLATRLQSAPPGFEKYAEGAWDPPTAAETTAILAAIQRLDRLHDAVADLLLSEAVHQLVAGNPTRSSAAMDALAGDGLPAEPDVVATPASGVPLTHQLMVALPRSSGAAEHGWVKRPRAAADPELESWLRDALGPAGGIALAADDGGTPTASLAEAEMAAIDLVAATGGVPAVQDGTGSALLGLWRRLRLRVPALPEEPLVARPAGLPDDVLTLGEAWALATSLRTLVARSRALTPRDLVRAGAVGAVSPDQQVPIALRTVDLVDLRARAERAVELLEAVDLTVPGGRPGRLTLVQRLARFSISSPADLAGLADDELADHVARLATQADQRRVAARAALTAAPADPAPGDPDAATLEAELVRVLTRVVTTVFDDGLPTLPVIHGKTVDPFVQAWHDASTAHVADGAAIRPWVSRLARVRPGVARHAETLLLRAALGRHRPLRVVQQPAGALPGWIGRPFDVRALGADSVLGCVVEAGEGFHPSQRMAGLVVDSWVETVPRLRNTVDPVTSEARTTDVRTTGLAVHANGPDARAPQALLLAVSPDGGPWTWERAVAVLDETRELARLRLVTLEQVPLAGRMLPAAYEQDWSLQGEPVIDPRLLTEFADIRGTMRHVSEA